MKTCTKCKVRYESLDYFPLRKGRKSGYSDICNKCHDTQTSYKPKRKYTSLKKTNKQNKNMLEKLIWHSIRIENKILKEENKKLCCSCHEIFEINELRVGSYCKKCFSIYQQKLNEKRKEERKLDSIKKEQNKIKNKIKYEKQKEYRKNNKDIVIEANKKYYENNKEKHKEYQIKHKSRYALHTKEYYLKKKLEKEQQKLSSK